MLDVRVQFKPGEKIPFNEPREGKEKSPSSPPRAKRRDPNGMGIRQPKLDLKGEGLGIKKMEAGIVDAARYAWSGVFKHFGPGNHPGTGTPQTVHAAENFTAKVIVGPRPGGEAGELTFPYKVVRKFTVKGVHRVRDADRLPSILDKGLDPLKSDGIFGRGTYASYGDFSGKIAQQEIIRGFPLDVEVSLDKVIMVEYEPPTNDNSKGHSEGRAIESLMHAARDYLQRSQPDRFPDRDSTSSFRIDLRAELLAIGVDGLVFDKGMSLNPGLAWGTQVVVLDKDSITITPESLARAEKEARNYSFAKAHLPNIIMWADFLALFDEEFDKHAGPGDHPSGSPQTVHGVKGSGTPDNYRVVGTDDKQLPYMWERKHNVEDAYMLEPDTDPATRFAHGRAVLEQLRSSELWRRRDNKDYGFDSSGHPTLEAAKVANPIKNGNWNYVMEKEGTVVTRFYLEKTDSQKPGEVEIVELLEKPFDFDEVLQKPTFAPRNKFEEKYGVDPWEYPGSHDWSVQQGRLKDPEAEAETDRWIREAGARKLRIKQDISAGDLSPEDAKEFLGYEDRYKEELVPLPDVLYTVTTANDAVMAEGLKTRAQLAQNKGGLGLGGGPEDTISLTGDADTAKAILVNMQERHDFLNGVIKPEELKARAESGSDASRPYWSKDLQQYYDKIDIDPGPDATYGKTRVERLGDFHDTYSSSRDFASGAMNPLYVSTDDVAFAAIPRHQISIIKAKRATGSVGPGRGYQLQSMGEWRIYTGKAVTDLEVFD